MSYPNMSYCMFHNTLLAMRQVLGAMEDEGGALLADMSADERRAFDELYHAAESFQDLAQDVLAEFEETEAETEL